MIIQNQNSDFYYWYDETPNDWESAFRGSLWEYDEVRGQYYLHTFAKEQADLKWDNPAVRRAMKYESSSAQRLICTSHSEASSAQQELLPTLTSMLEWKEQWLLILTSSSIFDKETEQSLLWKEW